MNTPRTARSFGGLAVVAALLVSSGCDDSNEEAADLPSRGALTETDQQVSTSLQCP